MQENDGDAETIGHYLSNLLVKIIDEQESFSGKRPFGNSGWIYELYIPLVNGNFIPGELDEDGSIAEVDYEEAEKLLIELIEYKFDR